MSSENNYIKKMNTIIQELNEAKKCLIHQKYKCGEHEFIGALSENAKVPFYINKIERQEDEKNEQGG